MKKTIFLIIVSVVLSAKTFAQHHMQQDTTNKMDTMDKMPMDPMQMMSHSFSRNLPMNRNGSGM